MSDVHIIEFAMKDGHSPEGVLGKLRDRAERHGWAFGREQGFPSNTSGWRESGHYLFHWRNQPHQYMALRLRSSKEFPGVVLKITLNNIYFAGSSWLSERPDEREEARAFSRLLLEYVEHAIEAISPSYGLGDTGSAVSEEQLETTILPPEGQLMSHLESKVHPPWLAYFGPELIRGQVAKRIQRLDSLENREVAGGVLVVFRENPLGHLEDSSIFPVPDNHQRLPENVERDEEDEPGI